MPRALALSPHLDDAAFSCGGTLARLAAQGWDVTLCTAFTCSVPSPTGFALACQLDKGLPEDVDYMALRRAEDRIACDRLSVSPLWLDLPEAPHRGYLDAKALFAPPRDEDVVLAPLSDRLRGLLENPFALILAPQALGGHVDHVLLATALRSVLPVCLPVWWWTDFPYTIRPGTHPARPFEIEMELLPRIAVAGDATARLAACMAYKTQLGFQFSGPAGLADALRSVGPIEHFHAQGGEAFIPSQHPASGRERRNVAATGTAPA